LIFFLFHLTIVGMKAKAKQSKTKQNKLIETRWNKSKQIETNKKQSFKSIEFIAR